MTKFKEKAWEIFRVWIFGKISPPAPGLALLMIVLSTRIILYTLLQSGDTWWVWNGAQWRHLVQVLQTKAIRRLVITEKAPTGALSWLKAATTAFTFKTLLGHYAKWALTPRSLNVKLGPRRNYHKGRAAIRHYANQTARPLWPFRRGPNFTLRDRGVNAHLA